jgi:hypothetical protein
VGLAGAGIPGDSTGEVTQSFSTTIIMCPTAESLPAVSPVVEVVISGEAMAGPHSKIMGPET